jgi:hypothetical protein
MRELPARPDLDQLRHQAKDLLHAAQRGDPEAIARIRAVSDRVILVSAQLAIAREHGFPSWAKLKLEVERRDILNSRDLSRLTRLLSAMLRPVPDGGAAPSTSPSCIHGAVSLTRRNEHWTFALIEASRCGDRGAWPPRPCARRR